jgi:hypothetical protein
MTRSMQPAGRRRRWRTAVSADAAGIAGERGAWGALLRGRRPLGGGCPTARGRAAKQSAVIVGIIGKSYQHPQAKSAEIGGRAIPGVLGAVSWRPVASVTSGRLPSRRQRTGHPARQLSCAVCTRFSPLRAVRLRPHDAGMDRRGRVRRRLAAQDPPASAIRWPSRRWVPMATR